MKILIDTNIILDVLLQRKDFYDDSKKVLEKCENKEILGYVSVNTITDLYYLIHKSLHDTRKTYTALAAILDIVKVLTVTNEDVLNAFLKQKTDFEDCLLETVAISNKLDAIITRNKKDFQKDLINVYDANEFLKISGK